MSGGEEMGKRQPRVKADAAASESHGTTGPRPQRLCDGPDCLTVFTPTRSDQRYCSTNCRRAAEAHNSHACPVCGVVHYAKAASRLRLSETQI